ncbi:MAG: hypothetical protein NTY93_01405 [Candidatus Kaiserbacteria bacterium]|nr:hypothetical protein [Candidatus Kaiserbacteria bacterium]
MNAKAKVWALSPNEIEKYGVKRNWSLKPLQTQEDVPREPELVAGLRDVLQKMNVHKAYAPHVASASAQVIDINELTERINLGAGRYLYRNCSVPADGVFIKPQHAFMMSSAGCPIIIATGGEHMVVAHAGRDSLIDYAAVIGEPDRQQVSIVDSIVEAFIMRGVSRDEIAMCMLFSIPVEKFEHKLNHPSHGYYNQRLDQFAEVRWPGCIHRSNGSLFLDLETVFKKQALKAEIGEKNVQVMDSLSLHSSLAHTHDGKKNPVDERGHEISRRNLLIVKRCD